MDIKYPIENEYMKCVLQINGFSCLHPRVRSNRRIDRVKGRDNKLIEISILVISIVRVNGKQNCISFFVPSLIELMSQLHYIVIV